MNDVSELVKATNKITEGLQTLIDDNLITKSEFNQVVDLAINALEKSRIER